VLLSAPGELVWETPLRASGKSIAAPVQMRTGDVRQDDNPTFALQTAAFISGTLTNVAGPTSPHTNSVSGTQE